MLGMIADMWDDGWVGRALLFLMTILVLSIPAAIYSSVQEAERWALFKAEHDCKVVGRERGHTSTGVAPIVGGSGGVGVVVVNTPDKTGWLCDDGVTYWR